MGWYITLATFGLVWLLYATQEREKFAGSVKTLVAFGIPGIVFYEYFFGDRTSWLWNLAGAAIAGGIFSGAAILCYIIGIFVFMLMIGVPKS